LKIYIKKYPSHLSILNIYIYICKNIKDMSYNKLVCFDFDGTLCFTPEPIEGEKIFLAKTGNQWPYNGWWGKTESIDMDIFHIPVNQWVYKKYLEAVAEPNTYIILATGRLEKVPGMRENVERILESHNLSFDEVYLNTGGDTYRFKTKLFEDLIEKLGVKEFTMYDDRHEHLVKFETWAIDQPSDVNIVDVVNKKTKTITNL
jgi:hypothetical protein